MSKRVSDSVRNRVRRRKRISFKVKGTAERPRLAVFRSNTAFYAQIIDDDKAQTLVSMATNSKDLKGKAQNTKDGVKALGQALAKKASAAKIDKVVFDRAGYLYHGKVKAFADGAREGGLKF
ncbi:MAG: 50S ribosomal protein L18 [Bacteriovoracia bacterium]